MLRMLPFMRIRKPLQLAQLTVRQPHPHRQPLLAGLMIWESSLAQLVNVDQP